MSSNYNKERTNESHSYWMRSNIRLLAYALVLIIIPIFILATSGVLELSSPLTNLTTNVNYEFTPQAIVDTEDTINHLQNLNLTPHHSVKIFTVNGKDGQHIEEKILHGRFLHITDMHPDELNVIGGAIRLKCHKKKKQITSNSDISHKYGDALSGCDAPIDLYNATLDWVRENLKDHIDFVIWTGDNIRHDNDRSHPRTEADIFEMNERVARDMSMAFMDDGEDNVDPLSRRVKIVPSLGNNDVYPHNLFAPGPTLQTRELFNIWRPFIPNEQMHTFDRGAYFFREVIPGKLVVLSINTLYWFQSNPLNDNCDSKKQPGYKLFLWLGATLKECRKRGLKVWLSGHVPPIPKNIHHSCYAKISVWMHEYRDLIIGGVWGHMNIDHWVPLDSVKAWRSIERRLLTLGLLEDSQSLGYIDYEQLDTIMDMDIDMDIDADIDESDDDALDEIQTVEDLYTSLGYDLDDESDSPLHIFSDRYMGAPNAKVTYLEGIRDTMYAKLKGRKGGVHSERYGIAHISSSVIPTYNPGMRVWEYNVTDFNSLFTKNSNDSGKQNGGIFNIFRKGVVPDNVFVQEDWTEFFINLEMQLDDEAKLEQLFVQMENDESKFDTDEYKSLLSPINDGTIPKPMPENLPLGPAYVPQTFTPERYTQYYVDLNAINYRKPEKKPEDWEFAFNVHYSTEEFADSLLVKDWVRMGRKLAKSGRLEDPTLDETDVEIEKKGKSSKKAKGRKGKSKGKGKVKQGKNKFVKFWEKYVDRAFMSSGYQELDGATN